MKYNIETIKKIVRENPTTEIIYFWGHTPNPKKVTAGMTAISRWREYNTTPRNSI